MEILIKKLLITIVKKWKKILKDNPIIYKEKLTKKCKKGYYKGSMVADPGNTFHFYRQDPDGTWSHKPGTLPITKLDADKLPIYTPYTSNRDYSTLEMMILLIIQNSVVIIVFQVMN